MRPVLFHILNFPVPSYGFFLALSFLMGTGLAAWFARKEGLKPEAILDVAIWTIVGAFAGARAYYVILHFSDFRGDIQSAFIPFLKNGEGFSGLVFYGGLVGGAFAAFFYLKRRNYPVLRYFDSMAPSLALGLALTRIGCFLNGCCYGTGWDGPLAVSFPPSSPPGRFQDEIQAGSLHPSQLYESFGGLAILIFLLTFRHRSRQWTGSQILLVILLYAVLRFFVDFTRHYGPGEKLWALTHGQILSVPLVVVCSALALRFLRPGPRVSGA